MQEYRQLTLVVNEEQKTVKKKCISKHFKNTFEQVYRAKKRQGKLARE